MSWIRGSLIIALVAVTAGCGSNEQNEKLADAQACMNDSTKDTVSKCMSKLDGVDGDRASLMRCSIKLMEEGFNTGDKVIQIAEAFENTEGNGNPTVAAMSILAFTSSEEADENLENVTEAKDYCLDSGAEFFMKLTGFAHIATTLTSSELGATFTGGEAPTEEQIATLIDAAKMNTDVQEAIGQTVIDTYAASCQAEVKEDFCAEMDAAMTEVSDPNDPIAVALKLLDQLSGT